MIGYFTTLTCRLRHDAVSSSDSMASNNRMTNEQRTLTMWKEAIVAQSTVLSQHLPGGIEENRETLSG
jgi:hypothetical protein